MNRFLSIRVFSVFQRQIIGFGLLISYMCLQLIDSTESRKFRRKEFVLLNILQIPVRSDILFLSFFVLKAFIHSGMHN